MKTTRQNNPIDDQNQQMQVIGQIEAFLEQMIRQMPPDEAEMARDGPGRPRVLPSMCLWAGLLTCVARGLSSQLDLWRLLSQGNFWFYPRFAVSDQAVYKRLEQEGIQPLQHLFTQVHSVLAQRLGPYQENGLAPFATQVLALDETTLDRVARLLPALRAQPNGSKLLLGGKVAALFNLRVQQWERIQHIEEPHQNSKVAARGMLEAVPKESLVLMDLGYFGFELFDWLTTRKVWWISRMRERTSYEIVHTFFENQDEAGNTAVFDGLVWLGAYRADRAAHAVRLVRFRVGSTEYHYITSVLDPTKLTIADIARLYARRWDIELAFKLVKRHLGLQAFGAAGIWGCRHLGLQAFGAAGIWGCICCGRLKMW